MHFRALCAEVAAAVRVRHGEAMGRVVSAAESNSDTANLRIKQLEGQCRDFSREREQFAHERAQYQNERDLIAKDRAQLKIELEKLNSL